MHLNGERASPGLALPLAAGTLAEAGEVLLADSHVAGGVSWAGVVYQDFEVHLGFPAQPRYAHPKGTAIGSYRLPEGFIAVENGSETERKDGAVPETDTNYPRVFQNGLVF